VKETYWLTNFSLSLDSFDLHVIEISSIKSIKLSFFYDIFDAYTPQNVISLLSSSFLGSTNFSTLLHDIVLQDHTIDRWRWFLDPVLGYTVKGAYHLLTSVEEPPARGLFDDVWHKHVPLKVSLFAWRLLCNRLPTQDCEASCPSTRC